MFNDMKDSGRSIRIASGLLIVFGALLIFHMSAWPVAPNAQAEGNFSFTQVVDNLDYKKNTRLHAKEFLREHRGVPLVTDGEVVDVIGGRGRVKILVANRARTLIKGYNLVLTAYAEQEKAADLKKGQRIRFKGYLHNFKAGRYGGVIVYLDDCQIY